MANLLIAALCTYQLDWGGYGLMALVVIFILPIGIGCGVAWAGHPPDRGRSQRRSPWLAWTMVIALCGLPPTMILSLWPLRVAFFTSRPALEELADQVAEGRLLASPVWAGAYYVTDTAVDEETGDVGLVTFGAATNSRFGFVRVGDKTRTKNLGPFKKLELDIVLNSRWRYQSEE